MDKHVHKPVSPDVNTVILTLQIEAQDEIDADKLSQLTGYLRSELDDLDIESVTDVRDQAIPLGAKVVDPLTAGALIVVVLQAALPKVMEFLQAWTLRGEGQAVKIKAQLGNQSVEVEYPMKMAPDEARKHIDMIMDELSEKKKH